MDEEPGVRVNQVWRSKRGGPRFRILDGIDGQVLVVNVRGKQNPRRILLDRLVREYELVKDIPRL